MNREMKVFFGGDDAASLHRIEALRMEVWKDIVEAASLPGFQLDETDYRAWHVVCQNDTQAVASARLSIHADAAGLPDICSYHPYVSKMRFPIAVMSRLVVHPDVRLNGIARSLDDQRNKLAQSEAVAQVWIEVSDGRHRSMQDQGFEAVGPSADPSVPGRWLIYARNL